MNLHLIFHSIKRLIIILMLFALVDYFIESTISFFYYHTANHAAVSKIQTLNWFICALLFNNEVIIDDWIKGVEQIITSLDGNRVYISIFENGDSSDRTAQYLQEFKKRLDDLQIANTIITDKRLSKKGMRRIEYLALYRNYVMAPLKNDAIQNLNWNPNSTNVLFLNDIYFRSDDIIRLMGTNDLEYDMACGFDFYYSFYDSWVSRDLKGNSFTDNYPYFVDKTSQRSVRNWRPFRVYSCWNGAISFKAEPLITHNITFREQLPTESYQCECFYICRDFWLHSYNKILINPSVIVTYERWLFYLQKWFYYPFMNWIIDWWKFWFSRNRAEENLDVLDFVNFPQSAIDYPNYW